MKGRAFSSYIVLSRLFIWVRRNAFERLDEISGVQNRKPVGKGEVCSGISENSSCFKFQNSFYDYERVSFTLFAPEPRSPDEKVLPIALQYTEKSKSTSCRQI